MLIFKTNFGNIEIEIDTENTPITAENFLNYAESGFYNGTIFHRVINGFMIQGGGFESGMEQKTTEDTIANETKHAKPNKRGTLAMARTSEPHSASSQFFFNVVDNDFLNFKSETNAGWGYCVFAEIISGMDIIDKIKHVETTTRAGHQDVPADDVILEKVIIVNDD